MRIVHLADTHLGHYRGRGYVEELVDKIVAEEPDMVLFTGDAFESWYSLEENTLASFERITVPVYFVTGNHDENINAESVKELLKKTGVRVLENEVTEYKGLTIVGLDYMNADKASMNLLHAPQIKETIEETVSKLIDEEQTSPVIVMHHSPEGAKYIEEAGGDLLLAGHTHGGQSWPLTWIMNVAGDYGRGGFGNPVICG